MKEPGDTHSGGDPRLPLRKRVAMAGQGFRSMIGRYPRDVASVVRRDSKGTVRDGFAVRWQDAVERVAPGQCIVSWLGHCTVLLRLGGAGGQGRTIVTDPVLSERIGLSVGGVRIGPARLSPVPVAADELPPIDLVIVSHAHFDHLDRQTLKHLARKGTELVTAESTRSLIPRGFSHVHELRWGHQFVAAGVHLSAIKPAHWGARTAYDRHRGYNAYELQVQEASGHLQRVLFAGDTAQTRAFDGRGPFDLGIFGIGAYNPWHHAHATPEQAWEMARRAGVQRVLPVHHSTFKLSDEPLDEPMARLLKAADLADGRIDGDPEGMARVLDAEVGQIVVFRAQAKNSTDQSPGPESRH